MIESKRLPRSFSTVPSPNVLGNRIQFATKATPQERIERFLFLAERVLRPATLLMFVHYFQGGGAARNLQSFGLARKFEVHPNVRRAVSGFAQRLTSVAVHHARTRCSTRQRRGRANVFSFDFNDQTTTDVTNDRDLLPVGRSRLIRRSHVTVRVDCQNGRFDLNARLQFNLTDAFVDVLDLGSTIPGNQEIPKGVPFAIVHTWTESFVRRNVRLR